jgi:predicted metalloenzyme YecM
MNTLSDVFSLEWLQSQATTYSDEVLAFLQQLSISHMVGPFDHLAIKAYDSADYESVIGAIRPACKSLSYIQMNNRRLATAHLREPIITRHFGACAWLEIMEPRPEKVGNDYVGFEHAEIFCKNFAALETLLKAKHIEYEFADNGAHRAYVLRINEAGQELKFTDTSLSIIVAHQTKEGISIPL